jgi:nitric oxide reductase subunit B
LTCITIGNDDPDEHARIYQGMHHEYHPQTLAGAGGVARHVLRRTAVDRQGGPPAGAPLPTAVVTIDSQTLYTKADMEEGSQVWQSIGGEELSSICGHGGLLAPYWSADWLHHESIPMLDLLCRDASLGPYDSLTAQQQAPRKARVQEELRTNTYSAASSIITVSTLRAHAMDAVAAHYMSLFGNDPATHKLREGYAMRENTGAEMGHRREVTALF